MDITDKNFIQNIDVQDFFDNSLDLVCIADNRGNFLKISNSFKTFLGFELSVLTKSRYLEFVHREDIDKTIKQIENLEKNNILYSFNNRLRRKDRNYINFEWVYHPYNENTICIARETSDNNLPIVAENKDFLGESLKIAQIGCINYDIVNNRWTSTKILDEIFGITPEYERTYEGWLNIINPKYRQIMLDYFANDVLSKRKPFDKEYIINNISTGEEIWVHGRGTVYYDQNNNPLNMISTVQNITDRKNKEQELLYYTYRDILTGLYNRNFFESQINNFKQDYSLPISIIVGDINGLKMTNDAFGHNNGDVLLKNIAEILKQTCRKQDVIIRWGGDEFLIIMFNTSQKDAQIACDRIINNCKSSTIKVGFGHLNLSISLGFATIENNNENIHKVIKIAEEKMYRNKLIDNEGHHSQVINSIITALANNNIEEKAHSERVKQYAVKIGEMLNLNSEQLYEIGIVALLHDIGKIAIDENVLNKVGLLTNEEMEKIKRHSDVGYLIAISNPDLKHIANYILCHHERWDGKGYPRGIEGQKIPLVSRIISVADSFDAMINRNYKKPLTKDEAITELKNNSGTQFDPHIAETFINIIK